MNFEYFIARKVAASGQQSFSLLIIRIAIVAIAISMAVMIMATSLIRGFQNGISEKIFGFWGHIHVFDTGMNRSFEATPIDMNHDFYQSIDSIESVLYRYHDATLRFPIEGQLVEKHTKGGIRHIQVTATLPGIIKVNKLLEGIVLKGVGDDFDWSNLKPYIIEGEIINTSGAEHSRELIISEVTARRLKLKVGDRLNIHFVQGREQLARRFHIIGIYKTGMEEFDRKFALADIRIIQDIYGWEKNQVGGFEIFVDNLDDLDILNEYLYLEVLPNHLFSQTIRDKFPSIFEWLSLQDINKYVILSLMLIVSIINMVTALMILILERTNMIGILKALGSTNWSVRKIFLWYAAYIVLLGLFFGNLIGLALCWIQQHFEIVTLSEKDYYLSVAPIEVNFWTILLLNIGTLLITLLVLVVPSYLVSKISPVKAIRFK
ncbi:MAG TPA: ABC transporter permease [Phaeodactylibacter sp.]|nr:ABC transporter permease [Phaeodactylibacter sp.]